MTGKNLVVNNRILHYKGIFRVNELMSTIFKTLQELQYEKQEKKTEETVTPSGKHFYLELRPFKKKTNFITLMIKIKVMLDDVTEVTKEVDGVKKVFQVGEVNVVFDSWSLTDYAKRWRMRPWFYFLKGFVNKYIYRYPMEESYIRELQSDTDKIYSELRALFNLYKYQVSE